MSAFLASQKTYDYIANGLYDAAIRHNSEYCHTVRGFLGIDKDATDATLEEVVTDTVCKLYDLNRLALVTRYSDVWERDNHFPLDIKRSAIIDPVQFIKSISCVLYQCSEYLTDETNTYKQWSDLRNRLAYAFVVRSAEYDKAEWDLAA